MDGLKVWYDYKRDCYVSNVAFLCAKEWKIPVQIVAQAFAIWMNENHPEYESFAS